MDGVVLEPPDTLHGQLQRGRGVGWQRGLTTPGAAELVYDCIRRDARQDHQVESRRWYLSRLVKELDLPAGPVGEHLNLDPQVWGAETIRTCSVCDRPIEPPRFRQVRISLRVDGSRLRTGRDAGVRRAAGPRCRVGPPGGIATADPR